MNQELVEDQLSAALQSSSKHEYSSCPSQSLSRQSALVTTTQPTLETERGGLERLKSKNLQNEALAKRNPQPLGISETGNVDQEGCPAQVARAAVSQIQKLKGYHHQQQAVGVKM